MTRQARRSCSRGDHASPRFHLSRAIEDGVHRGWPLVMAVLNVTPDSFSDGGRFAEPARAIEHALQCVEHGADIVDVGGESTRPGSIVPGAEEEMARVIPVIEALRKASDVAISVDTSKPDVMRAAAAAGADMINDVRALGNDDALQTAAQLQLPVVLMHMAGEPQTMQDDPQYDDVVSQVFAFLVDRAEQCQRAGIDGTQIALDPGFGFGKMVQHNLSLLKHLRQLVDTGYPVLVGLSRKSMIRTLLGRELDGRMPASVSLAIEASARGASIVRVHDVLPTVDALKIRAAVEHAH
ncbi:MAG: dihydropteroate synthase [Gammaproteobacteria bacterium]|jgi:dihydropteroate synthase